MHEAIMGSSQNQDQSLLGTKNTGLFLKWNLGPFIVPFIEIALVKRQLQGHLALKNGGRYRTRTYDPPACKVGLLKMRPFQLQLQPTGHPPIYR
jgi:hypothetical protein